MAHPGPKTIRTPRTRALEIGTNPNGFIGGVVYDPQAGHPIAAGYPSQHYSHTPGHGTTIAAPVNGQTNPIK